MKISLLVSLIIITMFSVEVCAQRNTRKDKLYTVSGIGTSLPIGQTDDFMSPKISTTLGVNLGLGNGEVFLFPKFNLHAFSYSGIKPDEAGQTTVLKGRASTYLLNLALGYRKFVDNFAFYGYAGAGGGFILTPTATLNNTGTALTMKNKSHTMPMLECGLGTELNLGGLAVFAEASYMHGFKQIQERSFTTAPITFGIKPNLSKLFK